jgi:radical SAM protein with 4Fe4S-binding SPASM domain
MLRLLFWESTIRCNLSCAHCRRLEADDAAETDLSTAQAKELIEQTAQLGRTQQSMPILVFSGGEPLCRTDLFELIKLATSRQIKCSLATNGTLIDETIADKIKTAGVERVSVSLDGATGDVHNKLRRLDGAFEAAVNGIRHLRNAAIPFQINMTLTRQNAYQLDAMFALAREVGALAVHFFMLVPVGCGGEYAQADRLSPVEYEQLLTRIALQKSVCDVEIKVTCAPHYERIIRQQGLVSNPDSRGCLAGSRVLFVSHRGQVFPCGYLPVECGNILQTPLAEIWFTSTDLARMRDPEQLKGKCGICEYRFACGGCRGRAMAATDDYMQEEPMCVYVPARKAEHD